MNAQVPSDTKLLDKAWKDFMASWCALRALVEAGGATIKMEVKVKAAKGKRK
jgi:hypothetical protein